MRVQGNNEIPGNARDKKLETTVKTGETPVAATNNNEPEKTQLNTGKQAQDTIEISARAQQFLKGEKTEQGQAAGVRPEMVARARQVLQSGTYNDNGVIEKTAAKIAGVLSAEG